MTLRKWFYDLSGEGGHLLQGSVITSQSAGRDTVISKIIRKHFGGSGITMGWDIDGIKLIHNDFIS